MLLKDILMSPELKSRQLAEQVLDNIKAFHSCQLPAYLFTTCTHCCIVFLERKKKEKEKDQQCLEDTQVRHTL